MELHETLFRELRSAVDSHELWDNPLLDRMRNGGLDEPEWAYVCGHHLRYSSQFTRFLGALIARITDPVSRSIVIRNLIDEEGDGNQQEVHSTILKRFVVNRFGESALEPKDAHLSDGLAAKFLNLIESAEPAVGAAVLAFGCEALVSRLYRHFVDGMRKRGFSDEELVFFLLHIDCDDGHAEELLNLMRDLLPGEIDITAACRTAVVQALDARNRYYLALGRRLESYDAMDGIAELMVKPDRMAPCALSACKTDLTAEHPALYQNRAASGAIDFHVSRLNVPSSVLDPRLLTVERGMRTEFHAHAHESLFVVLKGTGIVRLGGQHVEVRPNDVVYVPRWLEHQTVNTGTEQIEILAITDFGLTRRFKGNTESAYRLRKS